jgi:hypothetical protein
MAFEGLQTETVSPAFTFTMRYASLRASALARPAVFEPHHRLAEHAQRRESIQLFCQRFRPRFCQPTAKRIGHRT